MTDKKIPTPTEFFKINPSEVEIPTPKEYFSKKKEDSESTSEVQASESKGFRKAKTDFTYEEPVAEPMVVESNKPAKPENSFEYIMNQAGDQSIVKKMIDFGVAYSNQLSLNSPSPVKGAVDELQNQAVDYKKYISGYDGNKLEDLASFGVSLILDAPIFSGFGKAGAALSKPVISALNLTKQSLLKEGVGKVTAKAITNNIGKKYAAQVISGMASSGAALGGYEGLQNLKDQIESGKDLEDVDWSENLKSIKRGTLIGSSIGPLAPTFGLAEKYFNNVISNSVAKNLVKVGLKTTEIPIEASVFTMVGSSLDKQPVSWQNYMDNVLMVGVMKATGALQHGFSDLSKNPKGDLYNVGFKPEEAEVVRDKADVGTMEELDLQPAKIETLLKDKGVPLSAKAKILWRFAGVRTDGLDMNVDNVEVTSFGDGAKIKTYNKDKELLDIQKFNTREEADNQALLINKQAEDLKLWDEARALTLQQRQKVEDKLGDTKPLGDIAIIPVNDRTADQQKEVVKFKEAIAKVKEEELKEAEKAAKEAAKKPSEKPKIASQETEETKSEPQVSPEEESVPGALLQPQKTVENAVPEPAVEPLPSEETKAPDIESLNTPISNENIGGQENALEVESPNEVDVRQQAGNGETLGERNAEPQIPTGESQEAQAPQETPEKGIIFKDKNYRDEVELKDALARGELTVQEYNQANGLLNKRNFDSSKDRLRDALGGLANIKNAVGGEATNNLTEVYNALVEYIKNAIRVYGDKIRSSRDVARLAGVKHNSVLRDAYQEATTGSAAKMRGFPKRIKEFQEFKDLKPDIEANPELRYDPQVLSDIKDRISTMTDEELVSASSPQWLESISEGNDNMAVLAYLERINRARAKGNDPMPIIEELSRKGTFWGQLIRQFAEVKGASAEGALTIFEKTLERMGRFMTPEQKAKFIELSTADIESRQKVKEQQEKARVLPTDENLKEFEKLRDEADKVYTNLAKYMQEVAPRNFWDVMGMALQGNLLTPMSQMTNIFANLVTVPITGSANTLVSVMDRLHTMVTGSERVTTLDPRAMLQGAKGFISGVKEAAKQIKTGVAVNEKAEIQRGFRPWRSLVQAITGENMAVTRAGKIAWQDRVSKMTEGLVGLPAEGMFRLLNLGDKPFYRMAESITLYRIGKSKGLKGEALQNFIRFPSEKAQALAEKSGKEATFQEDSRTAKAATGIANTIRNAIPLGAWRFLMRTQMPYVKTPANIISQTMDIALPPFSMAKGVYEAYKGNKRESLVHLGKAGIGIMMGMGARYLLQNGLMSGSADDDKKVRGLEYDAFPPNSVNLSGLRRLIAGGIPAYQKDDEIINYTKMGLLGMALGVQANIYKTGKELQAKNTEGKVDDATLRTLSALIEIPSYALEQSFLQGTSTLITAISDKQWDYWLTNMFKAVSSIPLPNTLDAANRATREYIPDLKGDNLSERLSNVIRNKLWMTENLAITRNLWGEKILQNPEGNNGWLNQMFNVVKLQELQGKPESKLIYDLYTRTEDADVIPSVPMRRITVNSKPIELDSKEYERYITLVGQKRKGLLLQYINNNRFKEKTDEQKIRLLKRIWDLGQQSGRSQFLKEQEK